MRAERVAYFPRPDLSSCRFDGGLVIADPQGRRLLAYNESAALIWQAILDGAPADTAAALLTREYGIATAQAHADAAAIVAHWHGLDLLGEGSQPSDVPATLAATSVVTREPTRAVHYAIGGRIFRTAIADDAIAQRIDAVLAPFRCDERSSDASISVAMAAGAEWVIRLNDGERLRSDVLAEVVGSVYQMMLEILYGCSDWLAIIHGAAVIERDVASILAGPSGSGKSTLAAGLAARGFRYAADDMAALLAPSGCLAPWPIPQSVKAGSWSELAAAYPELDDAPVLELGGKRAKCVPAPASAWTEAPCRVGRLVFPTFDPASVGEVVRLRPLEALQRLLQDRIWLGDVSSFANVERFLGWLQATPSLAIRYRTVEQAHALIDQFT